jgi:hypothetical protein
VGHQLGIDEEKGTSSVTQFVGASLLEAPRMDPQSWPAEPQDYKQECTEHAFTGVNSKSAWRATRL